MSVTFTAAYSPSDYLGWEITCACRDASTGVLSQEYAVVEGLFATHTPVCGDDYCAADPGTINAVPVEDSCPEVNFAEGNARFVLDALGFSAEGGLWGELDAEAFMGRVLTALAVAPTDEGTPSYDATTGTIVDDPLKVLVAALGGHDQKGPRVVMCGRHPGYLQKALRGLHEVAQWCLDHGRTVTGS